MHHIINQQINAARYLHCGLPFIDECVHLYTSEIFVTILNGYTMVRTALCKTYKKREQETLVHAPKLWAEEISKRALLFP